MKSARRIVHVCLAVSVLFWIASLFVGIAFVPQSGRFRFSCFGGVVLVHFLDVAHNHPPADAMRAGWLAQFPRGSYVFSEGPLNYHYIIPIPGCEVTMTTPVQLLQFNVASLWLPRIRNCRSSPAWYIQLPTIAPVLLFGLISLYWLLPFHRRRIRRQSGQCVACGYDLTANQSGKCPECGNPAPRYDELSDKFERLIQSLMLVAAPFEDQVASMPSFVCVPDEIALTFEYGCQFIPELRESGRIDERQADGLRQINEFFAKTSGRANADWWSLDRMKDDERWAESRSMAADLVGRFGRRLAKPDLYWIKFVPGS